MKSFTWAAALLFCVGLVGGCQGNKPPAPEPDVMPTSERVAAARERLTSQGMLVGTVDAVVDSAARVSGLDPKSVDPTEDLSFVDVQTERVVNIGRVRRTPTDQGALVVEASSYGERGPRVGDLVVKLK